MPQGSYTVKQAAQLTGIPEATLRMWERRYGIVEPRRSPSGYRLYSERQIGVLREMAAQVRAGVPASLAARAVLVSAESWPHLAATTPGDDDLVAAAASLDPTVLDEVIAHAFAHDDFENVADNWLLPQIIALGDAWESGRLTVAQEHFASAGLMRAIGAVFDEAPASNGSPVLIGLLAGERHEIALYAFATCLRRRGTNVVYLGADLPRDEWVQAAVGRGARAAVIGVSSRRAVNRAVELVELFSELRPPVSVWVGGGKRRSVSGAHDLPDKVSEAAAILHLSVKTGRA